MAKSRLAVVLLLALAASAASARQILQAGACPIDPAKQDLDFTAVASSCGDKKSICSTCICALVDVFTPALVAGGVAVNTTDPSSFPLDKSADIIRQCSEQYIVSMLMANVNVTALAGLSECSFGTGDKVPDCLAGQVADIRPGVNNTAFTAATTATGSPAAGAAPAASTSTAPDTEVTATSRVDPSATTPATQPTPAQPPAAPAPANGASAKSMSVMASVGALMIASLLL